jgi:hypothetical protein
VAEPTGPIVGIVPTFAKPSQGEIDKARAAAWKVLRNTKSQPDRIVRLRASTLVREVEKANQEKSAAHWAIAEMLWSGSIEGRIIALGGTGPKFDSVTAPKWEELPWNRAASSNVYCPAWDRWEVVWDPDSPVAVEPAACSIGRLGDVRLLLNSHYNRRDHQGFSPVQDIVSLDFGSR